MGTRDIWYIHMSTFIIKKNTIPMPYSSFYNYVCYTARTIVKSTYWTTTENGIERPKVQKQPQPFKVYFS